MTPTATIGRFHAAYRLLPAQLDAARRLDAVLREAFDGMLEAALERAGLVDERIICIRRVHVPVRLRLASTDSALAAAWCEQMVETIVRKVRDAARVQETGQTGLETVVVYPNRTRALFDMARSGIAGHFRRVWVWKRLGFWSPAASETVPQSVAETVHALMREPERILPVLTLLAREGSLPAFAARLDARQWEQLAGSVFRRAGVPLEQFPRIGDGVAETAEFEGTVERVVTRSPLIGALRGVDLPIAALPAIGALAVVESEPGSLLLPPDRLSTLVASVAERVSKIARNADAAPRRPGRETPVEPAAPPAVPESLSSHTADAVPYTEYGGLLFLIRIVDELMLPATMLEALPERPLQWTLFQLAMSLVPIPADDPAALAFCGLQPDGERPDRNELPPAPQEVERLDRWKAQVIETVAARFRQEPRTVAQLLHFVCRRPASVVADPGWIELRFPIQSVSTEIRRAGLDLDPGWIPWLGVVLRFVYE